MDPDREAEDGGDVEPVMKHNLMTSFTYTWLLDNPFSFSLEKDTMLTRAANTSSIISGCTLCWTFWVQKRAAISVSS